MHPFPKFPGHPDLPISVSHLLALLLFTSPLLPLMIKFKKHKCLQGAEAFRHRVLCTPERGGGGGGKEAHSQLLVHMGTATNIPGCSDLSPAVGLTCTKITGEVNIDPQNNAQYRAQSLKDMSLVPFLLQVLPTQLSIILPLSGQLR